MAFQVSPGVQVTEKDLTNVIPAVATSIAGIVIAAQKGPVGEITAIASEEELVSVFGQPQSDSNQFEDWFCAANYLGYSNALRVVRAQSDVKNACESGKTAILIKSTDDYTNNYNAGQADTGLYNARTAGSWGNSLQVSVCPSAAEFEQTFSGGENTAGVVETALDGGATQVVVDNSGGSGFNVGDIINFGEADGGEYKVTAINADTLTFERFGSANTEGGIRTPGTGVIADTTDIRRRWEYYDLFTSAPGTSDYVKDRSGVNTADELHIVVIDEDGAITGAPGTVLETYEGLSKLSDAKKADGSTNYYRDVLYNQSQYIYNMDHPSGGAGTGYGGTVLAQGTTIFGASGAESIHTVSLVNGADDYAVTSGEKKSGFDLMKDTETVEITLLMNGKEIDGTNGTDAINAIDMATDRKDTVAFVSPPSSAVVGVASEVTQTANVKTFMDKMPSSSYGFLDSGYKYMYDKYNDSFRFVPLNGDMAGLCARTDLVADSWFSPGGFNRGQVRGVVKLAYNPQKANRDILYKARVNPVVSFPGQGTVLFGDKTAQAKPSAFDRINVRRLFITLEKAISTAAKFQLFEFNDEFTRADFRNQVEPFLRDVQGRRGVTDFLVVCDSTNNPGSVVDRNEFVADIFIKPARSINFISLNFIATKTGVAFSEVVGA